MSAAEVTVVDDVSFDAVAPTIEFGEIAPTADRSARWLPLAWRRSAAGAWALSCLLIDVGALVAATMATGVAASDVGLAPLPSIWAIAFSAVVLALLGGSGLYRLGVQLHLLDHARKIVASVLLATMTALVAARVLVGSDGDVAREAVRQFAFASFYLVAGRAALYWCAANARRAGEATRPTLVVGAGRVAGTVVERLRERPELGLRPVAFLEDDPVDMLELELPHAGGPADLDRAISQYGIEHVVVTFSSARDEDLLHVVDRSTERGVGVSVVPRLYEQTTEELTVEHIGGLPFLTSRRVAPNGWYFRGKDAVDRVVAAAAIVATLPLLLVIALAVRVSLGRPILFRQVRVGRDGKPFELLKFRSMRLQRDDEAPTATNGSAFAPGGVEGVDRRTRVGAFLRRTSLDELPQLLNVLRGEMSIVGPRPERPEFVEIFERNVYRYSDRHRVKAGITGWAQVHGLRGKTSIADRAEWDNFYIENFSLWLDFKILLLTVRAVLLGAKTVE